MVTRRIYIVFALISLLGCSEREEYIFIDSSLANLSSNSQIFYPNFSPHIHHYAMLCIRDETYDILATTNNENEISINGNTLLGKSNLVTLDNLGLESDIHIKIENNTSESNYFIHCIDEGFPEFTVTFGSESLKSNDLYILSPRYVLDGETHQYHLIIDKNAVPRYRKKLDIGQRSIDFKFHRSGFYSYARRTSKNSFNQWDNEIVILDREFKKVNIVTTVGLNHTDNHDFLITPDDTYILMSYNSEYRDMSSYGRSSNELTRDSVLQEITFNGELLMEWNSWDHVDINDCKQHRWPDDYAHINSVSISEDRNLILSLRGCSQILKIDRKTGEKIWQLGGANTDFTIVGDPYKEFCGQHTASEIRGSLYIFDNGGFCLGERENDVGQFSRGLKYDLDYESMFAEFSLDYSLNNSYSEYTISGGSLFLTPNDDWIINWALRTGDLNSIEEVRKDGTLLVSIKMKKGELNPRTYRVYKEKGLYLPLNIDGQTSFYYSN